eukprot:12921169-Prorocentrum_lima.AAC.1
MGDVQGGLLSVEYKEGRTRPPCTGPGLGPSVKGSNHVTKGKWLHFDGTKWHAVTPTKGFRLSLVFFNSKSLQKLSLDDWQPLADLQFPC